MSKQATTDLATASKTMIKALGAGLSSDDFCTLVVHQLLHEQQANSCFLATLGNDSNVEVFGKYGYEKGIFEKHTLSVWEPSGITAALRTGQVQKLDSEEAYNEAYPSNRYSGLPGNGYIAIPFMTSDNLVGAIGISFHLKLSEINLSAELIELIQLASPFFAYQNNGNSRRGSGKAISFDKTSDSGEVLLTEREELILELMANGRTNQEIGIEMHLSESSIRSASVGLFKTLGVHSRKDAVAAAKHLGLMASLPVAKVLSVLGTHLVVVA